MADLVLLFVGFAFFGVSLAYAELCDRLGDTS